MIRRIHIDTLAAGMSSCKAINDDVAITCQRETCVISGEGTRLSSHDYAGVSPIDDRIPVSAVVPRIDRLSIRAMNDMYDLAWR